MGPSQHGKGDSIMAEIVGMGVVGVGAIGLRARCRI